MASIKENIILNGINTLTSILYPLITFPYAARVLLPDGIGTINFLNSIIGYIILLTSLGIPLYAVKEIAKYQNERKKRDMVAIEIIILSTILCLMGYIGVWFLAKYIPQIHQQASLFYILSLTIIFTTIGVTWFYQGIEDFKFITIRAIIIRTLAAVCLFIFVKSQSDLLIYGWIVVGSTVGNYIINFVHLGQYIDLKSIQIRELRILRHLRPSLHVFILNLITSLYVQLNSVMLGFISGEESVGYFTAGSKITHIGLVVIGSIGTVLLPRCSNLLKIGDLKGFSEIIRKSLNLTIALSLPMTLGLIILAVPTTLVFCGPDYVDSIPILYLNAPVVIIISLTNLMGIQILYPMDKVNIVIYSVSGGAIINLILNFIFIPSLQASGAAISTLIAELIVLLIQIILGKKYFPFKLRDLWNWKYVISSILMAIVLYLTISLITSDVMAIIVGLIVGILVYMISLLLMKESFLTNILKSIKIRVKHAE